jgi:hypothetical protein
MSSLPESPDTAREEDRPLTDTPAPDFAVQQTPPQPQRRKGPEPSYYLVS